MIVILVNVVVHTAAREEKFRMKSLVIDYDKTTYAFLSQPKKELDGCDNRPGRLKKRGGMGE